MRFACVSRQMAVVLGCSVVLSCGFGLREMSEHRLRARIAKSYQDRGINTYKKAPLVPIGFLVGEDGTKIPYTRDYYENPKFLLANLQHHKLRVAAFVVGVEGRPLVFSEKEFMKILAKAAVTMEAQKDYYQADQSQSHCFAFSRWWNVNNDSIILLAESKTQNAS